MVGIVVRADHDQQTQARATRLGARLGLPVLPTPPERGTYLDLDTRRLALRDGENPRGRPVYANLVGPEIDRRLRSGRRSALARALGLHRHPRQSVFDATCGLGRDSGILLGLGCVVLGAERSPVIQVLLDDAEARARQEQPDRLAGWRGLIHEDAAGWLEQQPAPVADIVYLDPMFGGQSRKALPKQAMQDLAAVVGFDPDDQRLFAAARAKAGKRVVVKRYARAPALAQPDRQLATRGARFDIYLVG